VKYLLSLRRSFFYFLGDAFHYLVLGSVSIVMVLPFLFQVYASLSSGDLSAYRNVIEQPWILRAMANSLLIAACVTTLQLIFCSLVGYGFAKHRFPGKNILFVILLTTMIIPLNTIMLPMFLLMRDLKWLDTYWPLIIPQAVSALGVFFMRQYISSIPDELLDAARLDGAGDLTLYRAIILPLSMPALTSLGIIVFISQWNNFVWPLVVLQTPEKFTFPIVLSSGALTGPEYMASIVISLIPLLIIYLLFQKRFLEGITFEALNG
jgi:multiple sugar transport system permease protein